MKSKGRSRDRRLLEVIQANGKGGTHGGGDGRGGKKRSNSGYILKKSKEGLFMDQM